jgi:mannose-6-phosphate isomerase-like protein (cupin superfamily)
VDEPFDQLSRAMASSLPRRHALKLIAATSVGCGLVACGRTADSSTHDGPRTSTTQPLAAPVASGYVLGPEEGEILMRPNGRVVVKVDPRRGSNAMALGVQELNPGAGIPEHKHETADEVLLFQQGHARAVLDGKIVDVAPGSTVYIPHGTWHAVENTGDPIQLLWVVTPPGLEGFFRGVGSPPGAPLKKLTPEEAAEIGRQHGTTYRTK